MSPFYTEFHYCPVCASTLESALLEGKPLKKCPSCDFIHWGEYSLGVGGVLLREDKGLLIQRAHNPGRGRWTIPGGYVERNEKIESAVVRELREETGLLTEPVSILAVKDRPEDVICAKHDIYIVFLLRYLEGDLNIDPGEVLQAGFFSPEECQDLNIAPLSLYLLRLALELKKANKAGLIRKEGINLVGSLSEIYTL